MRTLRIGALLTVTLSVSLLAACSSGGDRGANAKAAAKAETASRNFKTYETKTCKLTPSTG